MNINQIGQKKKKQAVRRLSQSSGGHGNRKDDLRRKLGAARRGADPGSDGGDRRFPRGSFRQVRAEESFDTRPFGPGVKRNIGHSRPSSKRHASPLANTAVDPTGSTKQESSNIFAKPTATAPFTENKSENIVRADDVFRSNPTERNASGRFQPKNRTWINKTVRQPQQETEKVFGSNSSPKQGNIFGGRQFETKTDTSKVGDRGIKFHPSPLAGLSNSSGNPGGSVISGLANPNISDRGNVSSLVGKYEQKTTTQSLQSFPVSSGGVFQSAVSSMTSQLSDPQSTNVFSEKNNTHPSSSLTPNSVSVFGSNSGMATTAPPNVNLFATGQKANSNTMISNSTTQNSTNNTSFYSGMPNVEKKSGGFGHVANSSLTSAGLFNSKQNTNSVGSNLAQGSFGLPSNKGGVFGDTGLESSNQQASVFGTSSLVAANATTQNSLQNKPSVLGNAGLSESSKQQASMFGSSSLVTQSTTTQNSAQNKPSIFGNTGLSESSNQQANIFGTSGTTTPIATPQNSVQNKPSVFGSAGFPESSNQQANIFGTSGTTTPSTTPQNGAQSKPSVFGNAGLSESSNQQANIFGTSNSMTPNTTAQYNLQNQPGIFASSAPPIPVTTQSLPPNQSLNSPMFNSKPLSNTSSVFGGAGLPTYSTNLFKTPDTFSQSSYPSSQNFCVNNPDTTKGAVFGNVGVPVTSAKLQNATSSFSSNGGPVSTKPASIFGGAGVSSDPSKTSVFALNKTSTDPGVVSITPFSDRLTSSAGIFGQAGSQTTGPFTVRVSSGPSSTKQASIFGGAGLSATSDVPQTSGIFSLNQDISQGPFSTGTKLSNPSFTQSPGSGSIFGNAGLSTAPDVPSTSSVFSLGHGTMQGPFSTSTTVSNPSFTQSPGSGGIFGNAGLSTTSDVPSTSCTFSLDQGTKQGPFSGKVSQPSSTLPPSPKSLKRTLSSTDVSDLTSILIKGLTEEFFDKKLLEKQFKIFGANKISLQPTKQSIVVNFASHEAARKAKSRALELFPMKDLHVFWYKKKGVGRTSRTPERLTGNKKEFRSRRMSISNALNSIDVSEFSPAWSAQERFTVLDEVDKRIRQAVTPYTHVASAPVIIGVCSDMCPEKERYMREFQANLSIFEMVPGTQDNRDGDVPKVEHTKAVKEYSRSAADKLEPLAHELRPVHVLQMTLDYLMTTVMNNSEEKWGEWFNFLWNRTRAIRKDITQQHLCDVQSADLVEKITRFHIFCAHYLCEEDMHSFDPKINNENLTKCLQTLKQFYVDLHTDQEVKCPNESEFQAYDILLNLNEGDTLRKAMQYHLEVRNSREVKFALEVFSSLNSQNFVRFFKLLKSASYLNACIMHRYFTQVRRSALRIMSKAYSPKEPLPLEVLQDLLAFEDKNETSRFCSHYNFATTEDSVQFSRVSFTDPETVFPLQRAGNLIESKRDYSIGQVVNGSPLTSCAIQEPLSSFDSNGRYVGLANLVQMLGSTPDTPESPHYIYEPPVNVPTEQRTPLVAIPTDDPLVIFNKAIESTCLDLLGQTVDGLVKDISHDAIRQIDLQRQLTRNFADEFLDDSLSVLLQEIAKECIAREVETKKRKIAVGLSRARVSLVCLHEIMNEFMKTELRFLAGDAKRVIREQMKAQSFTKMSAVIMREMLEDVMYKECHEVALTTRKELVKQKKAMLWGKAEILRRNQKKKHFKTWSKEFHTRVHIRNILQEIPAKPPMLTAKQQLEKLLSNKDSTANVLTSPPSYASMIKEREELQKLLTDMVNEQQMKRLRAMQPINLSRLYTELTTSKLMSTKRKQSDAISCMKLVVSFPGHVEHFSSESAESLIKFKLRAENAENCRPVSAELQGKFEQLSESQETSSQTCEFKYDIKACYGIITTSELQKVQRQHLLLGITGILFVLNSNGQIKDKMFWSNCRVRLHQILRSKPLVPRIPLVIMDINTRSTNRQSFMEEQLGIDELHREGLLSECVVYVQDEPTDSDELHKQLVHAILWLMSHSPQTPAIERDTLKGFVEKEILKHFTIPVYEEAALRKKALLPHQCPEVIVDLYNRVIDHVISVVTNVKLKDMSWPVPEFIATDSPPVSWNSSETFDRLDSILGKLKLPMPSSPATDGTWHSEYLLCLDYIDVLLDEEPLKKFGFALVNRVERILSPYANDSDDLPTTTFTAADIPWPQVVDACIKTLLSWLHTLSNGDAENVYYLPQDLDEFKQPLLWTEAGLETFKLVKGSSGVRKKKMSSNLSDVTSQVEEELTKIETSRSRVDVSEREPFVDDDMEEAARRFEQNLGKEKRNWKRFEEQLRSVLVEDDSQDLSLSVNGQGVKRKNPSWSWSLRPDKMNVKKSSTTGLEDIELPDLNSTRGYFETSIVSLRDGLEVHRHLEELTERKLREALDDSFE